MTNWFDYSGSKTDIFVKLSKIRAESSVLENNGVRKKEVKKG